MGASAENTVNAILGGNIPDTCTPQVPKLFDRATGMAAVLKACSAWVLQSLRLLKFCRSALAPHPPFKVPSVLYQVMMLMCAVVLTSHWIMQMCYG